MSDLSGIATEVTADAGVPWVSPVYIAVRDLVHGTGVDSRMTVDIGQVVGEGGKPSRR
jgi:hypothetical protein